MQYMAVVECASSGRLYIDDIISYGYKPLVINIKNPTDSIVNYRALIRKGLGDKAEYIDEDEDFEVFVEKLRKYDLKGVFPGTEVGVRLADRINKALGLKGNDDVTTYLRCTKKGMGEALGKAGLRRIETAVITCDDDIRRFWKDHDLDKCVIKYSETAGTDGLKICSACEDAIAHYNVIKNRPNHYGKMGVDLLIQEYIGGTEYIVNSISCEGKHMITDIWVYNKVQAEDGTLAYDYVKLVKNLGPGHTDLVQYAYKVLDAVEMKWGPCHTEIKIDRKGPVLIETNARPMGLAMTAPYLDEALGHHQTDLALAAYLDPTSFDRMARKAYNPPKYAMMKLLIVPEAIIGSFAPMFVFSNMIRSTREILFFGKEGINEYSRTVDLDSSPIAIKMINSDYGELTKDYELLRTVEAEYFHLFYTLGDKLEAVELKTDLDRIIKNLDPNRKFLVVTDEGNFTFQYGTKRISDHWEIYDGTVYAKCGSMTAEERYVSIFRSMYHIRPGGLFVAVPESYAAMPSGSVLMDFLMNIAGVRIMLPPYYFKGVLYGVK